MDAGSSSDENEIEIPEKGDVSSKTLGVRMQGKIASKMSSKGLVKQVVDGPTSDLIDNCYRIAKSYLKSKKDAEKIMKNLIKIVVKVALLSRNNMFTKEELVHVEQFQRKFKTVAKCVISFHEIDFTYDGEYMEKLLKESKELLTLFVKNHLTEKSLRRIEHVYTLYSDPNLLDAVFESGSSYRPYVTSITCSLNKLIENGEI